MLIPGARPLYLGAHEPKRVTSTAHALVISSAHAPSARYPVERVARVVCSAHTVDWSGTALALCLRAGIGITWLDECGAPMGALYPSEPAELSFAGALDLMLEDQEGADRYANWLRCRRMDVLKRWAQACLGTVTTREWQDTKRLWVYAGQYPVHLPLALRGACMAFVAAQLAAHGLPPTLPGPQAQPIKLADDLCELLWAEMNLCNGTLTDNADTTPALTALFERWNACHGGALLVHINSLHRIAMKALIA